MDKETPPDSGQGWFMRVRNAMFRMVGLTTEPLIVPISKMTAQRELNERASALILELSHRLFELVPHIQPGWNKAYYRFRYSGEGNASNASAASCTDGKHAKPVDAAQADFFREMDGKAAELIKLFGKPQGVLLLIIHADATYKADFDWGDLERWPIAADGGISGLPADH